MNTVATVEFEAANALDEKKIILPLGLLGFESIKEYTLISEPEQAPFCWLQVPNDPSLAFIVVSPFDVLPDYEPDIPRSDVEYLEIASPQDALLYNIVTLRGPQHATVNLKGPIVINRHTLKGKQLVLSNAARYQLQHPLPLTEQ